MSTIIKESIDVSLNLDKVITFTVTFNWQFSCLKHYERENMKSVPSIGSHPKKFNLLMLDYRSLGLVLIHCLNAKKYLESQ